LFRQGRWRWFWLRCAEQLGTQLTQLLFQKLNLGVFGNWCLRGCGWRLWPSRATVEKGR
jgi:hypothetical protein